MEQTKVIFKQEGDSVLAVFPEELGTSEWWGDCMCYAHNGQHHYCSTDYAKELPKAEAPDFWPLKRELEGLGYELRVMQRFHPNDMEARRQKLIEQRD